MSAFRLQRFLPVLSLLLLLAGCVGVRQVMVPPPEIVVAAVAETDAISISYSLNAAPEIGWAARLDITSPTGIGAGRVALASGAWPSPIILRLHLAGLEELQVMAGEATVQLSVSSGPGRDVRQTDASGQALAPASPTWLQVSRGEGYIDVRLPPALLPANVAAFDLSWIDFYR